MNSTSSSACVLEEFVVWSPSCPRWFIDQYKAISITFLGIYTFSLMLHARNLAVRLMKEKLKFKMSDSIMMADVAFVLASLSCMLEWSNYNTVHHNDFCIADIAADSRFSFALISM
jgi:hypothetical protein